MGDATSPASVSPCPKTVPVIPGAGFCRWLGGLLGWAVAVEGASVGCGGGGGAVGVAGDVPAPPMDSYLVVESAEQDQVGQAGGAAVGPVDQVVRLGHGCGLPAAGELAVLVAEGDGGAQVGRDGAGGAADVQWLAGGVEGGVEQGAAQAGCEPAGAGYQVQAPPREGGLQPLPGGRQAAGDPAVPAGAGGVASAGAGGVAVPGGLAAV